MTIAFQEVSRKIGNDPISTENAIPHSGKQTFKLNYKVRTIFEYL